MKMHPVEQILDSMFPAGLAARSPSPRPSPQGRGSIEASRPTLPDVPASRRRWRLFSLSLGERVGVRGKASSERMGLPMCRSILPSTRGAGLPALLTLWLTLVNLAATICIAADFSSTVPFELGEGGFLPGDSINIQRVTGTSPTIRTGETYCVEGTYTLVSQEKATLALYATTMSKGSTPTDPSQRMNIEKGSGTFRLVKTMWEEGYLHISFYPVSSGGSFGGVYFGQGEWVNRDKGWSHLDTHARSADHVAAVSSPVGPVSSTGPNQALLEYLGDPVEPPADMSAAYTKDGLIKAIQTAARNAGIKLKQVEIDDSEFPFLVGVICKEGDYSKLTDQLRKLDGYEYNGSVGSHTHNAMDVVPYRVFPSALGERIGHRTGLRMQVLCDKISRLDSR